MTDLVKENYKLLLTIIFAWMFISLFILPVLRKIKYLIILSSFYKNPYVKNIIYIGFVFIFLGLVLFLDLPHTVNVMSMFAISFSLGALITRANVPGGSWMTKHIPNQYHGRVFSLMNTAGELLTPLGIFIFSILFDTVSSHWIYISSGILIIVVIYLFLALSKIDLKDNALV